MAIKHKKVMDIFCDDAVNIAALGNFIYYISKLK
jgi:hypothetical protein